MKDISKITLHIRCQKGKAFSLTESGRKENTGSTAFSYRKEEEFQGEVRLEEIPDGKIGRISLCLKNEPFMENQNLELDKPVVIDLHMEETPEKITAMYMFNDWWTRPAFVDSFAKVPDRTQVLFLKYADRYACVVPMVDKVYKAYAVPGEEHTLRLQMAAYMSGMRSLDEIFVAAAEDETLYGAIEKVFAWIISYKGIKPKSKRRMPEIFRYLGWCSWDAFYRDISEEKVRAKAAELGSKKVPVRWMIMDDGWLSAKDEMLYDFIPEKEKFPDGFAGMIRDIKEETDIEWFGVWHSLAGYWGGILPGSKVEAQEKEHLVRCANGRILPYPKADPGFGFYRDWYEYLYQEGIDFVKVDAQSAVKNHYENSFPVGEAARGVHSALEGAVAYLDNRIINCMGMAMESILSRPNSAVSRNSDDFVPKRENGFAEHLLQNAYNSLYHDEVYYCDWDMFWTSHEDGVKHSLLRAISGGPVYFSDRVGETNPEIVKPLVYEDGEILMLNRSAKPAQDCLFADPFAEGVLKLTNVGSYGSNGLFGGIALFNLTDQEQKYRFTAGDIPELADLGDCWVYDYFRREAVHPGSGEACEGTLEAGGVAWYLILPYNEQGAFGGLTEKFNSPVAVEEIVCGERQITGIFREHGSVTLLTEKEPAHVFCDGEEITELLRRNGCVYTIPVKECEGRMSLTVSYRQ